MNEPELKWRFPLGANTEIKGINDAGVETFSSNSLRSLVRETLQNSLDAAIEDTVHVTFDEQTIPTDAVPNMWRLQNQLHECYTAGADRSPTARAFFRRALSVAKNKTLKVMKVSDYGTSGLRGGDTCKVGHGLDYG